MEYVCKVGTPAGEVVEQTFTAPDEAALRADLEQTGLLPLLRSAAAWACSGFRLSRPQGRRPIAPASSARSWRPCSRRACRSSSRSTSCSSGRGTRSSGARWRTVRDKVKSGIALSEAFRAEGDLYPPIFSASLVAGERSGSLEGVLRRFVAVPAPQPGPEEEGDLGRRSTRSCCSCMMAVLVVVMLVYVIPQFQGFYEGLERRAAPADPRPHGGRPLRCAANLPLDPSGLGIAVAGAWSLAPAATRPGAVLDRVAPAPPVPRTADAHVRHEPARAHALARCSRAACPC